MNRIEWGHPLVVFGGVFLVIVAIIWWSVVEKAERREAFMVECLQDHKQYECDALWGQAQPDVHVTNVYVPQTYK